MGLVLDVVITAASVQDRQGARPLLWNTHRACRYVRLVWADAGYTGKLSDWAASIKMTLEIISKRDPHAFEDLRQANQHLYQAWHAKSDELWNVDPAKLHELALKLAAAASKTQGPGKVVI